MKLKTRWFITDKNSVVIKLSQWKLYDKSPKHDGCTDLDQNVLLSHNTQGLFHVEQGFSRSEVQNYTKKGESPYATKLILVEF